MAKFIQYMTRDSLYDGPFDDVSGWPAAGMGYITVTEDGRIIIIDGGQPNDAETLSKLICAQTDDGKPVVDMWIITHPHLDHYGAVLEMSKNKALKNRIFVNKFVYLYPNEFYNKKGEHQSFAQQELEMKTVADAFGAQRVVPQRGDVISLDDITVEFLYVPDDCSVINTCNGSANHCSLILTVSGKEKKVMITGDAYRRTMQITAWRYANKLKCDILQMPHHALCDSCCADFYKYVDPKILLLPISSAGYRAMHSEYYTRLSDCMENLRVEEKAEKVYKAFEGDVEIYI